MLKINGSNISQIKINGFNIKIAKINNQVIFRDVKYTLTYSSYAYKFSANESGNYSLKYANGNTILEDYDSIMESTNTSDTYNALMNLNIAPENATIMPQRAMKRFWVEEPIKMSMIISIQIDARMYFAVLNFICSPSLDSR